MGRYKLAGLQKKKWGTKLCAHCAGHGRRGGSSGNKPCKPCGGTGASKCHIPGQCSGVACKL